MTIDDKIIDKNCDMISTEKQAKHQIYHLEKLVNMNILQANKYYLVIKVEIRTS